MSKKSGELVQGDKTGDIPLVDHLKEYLKEKHRKPGNVFLGVIHRLDRPVSGIVIFAKTSKALSRMSEQFRRSEVRKTYWAIVYNRPKKDQDTINQWLIRNPKQNKSYVVENPKDGAKEASLTYKCIASIERYHLLEINLHTGRHHQIRCQLASIGSCIKGDLKYGAPRSNKSASISLLSRAVSFVHPVTKDIINIIAPLPQDDIWYLFKTE